MSGTIDNLTGYMLGNNLHQAVPGEQWWPTDTLVFICRNIDVARAKLDESQLFSDFGIWTTIYRVKAPCINYDYIDDRLIWTRNASKIIVDAPVFVSNSPRVDNDVLLNRARIMMPAFARLFKSLDRRGK